MSLVGRVRCGYSFTFIFRWDTSEHDRREIGRMTSGLTCFLEHGKFHSTLHLSEKLFYSRIFIIEALKM